MTYPVLLFTLCIFPYNHMTLVYYQKKKKLLYSLSQWENGTWRLYINITTRKKLLKNSRHNTGNVVIINNDNERDVEQFNQPDTTRKTVTKEKNNWRILLLTPEKYLNNIMVQHKRPILRVIGERTNQMYFPQVKGISRSYCPRELWYFEAHRKWTQEIL